MAILDLTNANAAVDLTNPDFVTFSSTLSSSSTLWTWLTVAGHRVSVTGTGMVFSGGLPTAGMVTAISFDIGNDEAVANELVITGLSVPASALDDSADSFWRILDGVDTFTGPLADAPVISSSKIFGDGINARTGATGGNDVIDGRNFVLIASGDVTNVGSEATGAPSVQYTGGNDEMTASAGYGVFYGDVANVLGNEGNTSHLIGGNDRLDGTQNPNGVSFSGDAASMNRFAEVTGGADKLFGSSGQDRLTGDVDQMDGGGSAGPGVSIVIGGDDELYGYDGDDVMIGDVGNAGFPSGTIYGGDDIMYGGNGIDRMFGDCGSLFGIVTTGGDDRMYGGADRDVMYGQRGNDVLDGGTGRDAMFGDVGNDLYYVDEQFDEVYDGESPGSLDRVLTSVDYTIKVNEEIELFSTTNSAGLDPIKLTGNRFAQTILGNNGANSIDGGGAADRMTGLSGNDTYYVDNALDVVIESAGGGTADQVLASISYSLASDQQIEFLSTTNNAGTDAINLTGNNLANTILGNAGANLLNGGGGVDRMTGLGGNDLYYVDNALDVVIEAAGGGTADRVFTTVDYTLGVDQQIEILSTLNSSLTDSINLNGNNLANSIAGNNGVNIINGGGGIDSMNGLLGNDLYYVDNAADVVLEGVNAGTADRVLTSVDYTLGFNQQIELFSTANSTLTTAINLTGNNVTNRILGNNGVNSINGGLANDVLTGGAGADKFVFNTSITGGGNIDTISDFVHLTDDIQLAQTIFTSIGATLDTTELRLGTTATTTTQRIVYDSATGNLFFDADGSGATAQVQFAKVTAGTVLDVNDFIMI